MSDGDEDVLLRANARIGTLLKGKYRIDRVIGVGGMAVVYGAKHRNNADFALKMLHPELSSRKEMRDRFLREGYIANSVKHPGAVAVVDDDVAEDGAAFIVMEMLRGRPVDVLCHEAGGRLPLPVAVAIIAQLLDVLASAHANGIVHRDIKPANLFATHEGVLKVLDFGIARLKDAASSQMTNTGMVMGTPAYMSPEQALGKTSEINQQTDVWAAAATLFAVLSASSVHVGENSQHILVLAATTSPRPILTVVPDLPPAIAQVVDRGLAFHKQDRWLDAGTMRDALRSAYAGVYGPLNEREVLAEFLRPSAVRTAPTIVQNGTPVPGSTPGHVSTAAGSFRPMPGPVIPPRGATALRQAMPNAAPYEGTTAKPVATQPESVAAGAPRKRNSLPLAIAGVVIGVVVVGGGVAALQSSSGSPQRAASQHGDVPGPTAVVAEVPPSAKSAVPVVTVQPLVEAASAAPPEVRAAPSAVVTTTSRPNVKNGSGPAGVGAVSAAQAHKVAQGVAPQSSAPAGPPSSAPSTKPGCDPNYYYDSNGRRVFKTECFE